MPLQASSIKKQLVAYFDRNKRLRLTADRNGLRVNIPQECTRNMTNNIPITLTDSEWIDYFERCSRDDKHPISLMAVHLDEAVSIVVETKMNAARIVLDGTFTPIPEG